MLDDIAKHHLGIVSAVRIHEDSQQLVGVSLGLRPLLNHELELLYIAVHVIRTHEIPQSLLPDAVLLGRPQGAKFRAVLNQDLRGCGGSFGPGLDKCRKLDGLGIELVEQPRILQTFFGSRVLASQRIELRLQ